jgi:hypothetical protein
MKISPYLYESNGDAIRSDSLSGSVHKTGIFILSQCLAIVHFFTFRDKLFSAFFPPARLDSDMFKALIVARQKLDPQVIIVSDMGPSALRRNGFCRVGKTESLGKVSSSIFVPQTRISGLASLDWRKRSTIQGQPAKAISEASQRGSYGRSGESGCRLYWCVSRLTNTRSNLWKPL